MLQHLSIKLLQVNSVKTWTCEHRSVWADTALNFVGKRLAAISMSLQLNTKNQMQDFRHILQHSKKQM